MVWKASMCAAVHAASPWCVSEQAIMMLKLRNHKVSTCHMSTNAIAALLQQQTGLLMQCFMNKDAFSGVYAKLPCRG